MNADNVRNFLGKFKPQTPAGIDPDKLRADNRRTLLGGVLLCLVGAILVGAKYVSDEKEHAAFRERGIQITCPVIHKETVRRNDGGTSYRLTMQFASQNRGEIITFRQFVLEHTFNSLNEGDHIEIEYLPEKPQNARLRGEPKELDNPLYIIGILIVFAFGFAFFWWRESAAGSEPSEHITG